MIYHFLWVEYINKIIHFSNFIITNIDVFNCYLNYLNLIDFHYVLYQVHHLCLKFNIFCNIKNV